MPVVIQTILLLICSNIFMTFAWYGHLKNLQDKSWLITALLSWCIAFFEYMLHGACQSYWPYGVKCCTT
jgi:uncharacterized protein (DUF486 family)